MSTVSFAADSSSYEDWASARGLTPVAYPGAFVPVSRVEAARLLGVSLRTLDNWQKSGSMPQAGAIGGRVYWHPRVFHEWLEARLSAPRAGAITLTRQDAEQRKPATASAPPRPKLPKLASGERALARNGEKLARMLAGGR